jgi:hypothetical protein
MVNIDVIRKAYRKLSNSKSQPKSLIYPKWLVDKLTVDGTIECIDEVFGIKMTLKSKEEYQYCFKEVE